MSNRAAESVRWLSKATGCAFDVLMAIADFADADGWAYPGTETLARVSHWHERTVKRGLAELRARHADEPEQPGQGNGCHHRNSYRVKLIDRYPEALAEKQRWKDRHRGLDNGDTVTPLDDTKGEGPSPLDDKKGDSVTPFAAQTVTDRHPFGHPNGDSLSQKGDGESPDPNLILRLKISERGNSQHRDPAQKQDSKKNPALPPKRGRKRSKALARKQYRAWRDDVLVPAYPKHRLDGLKDVLFELCAMEPDENGLAAILAHLENWKRCEEWMKEGGRLCRTWASGLPITNACVIRPSAQTVTHQ